MPKFKPTLIILLLLISNTSVSQELIASDEVFFNPDYGAKPISVTDYDYNTYLFFLRKGDGSTSFLKYDEKFNLLKKQNTARENYGYPKIRGYSLDSDNTINLYFSNSDSERFLVQSLDKDGNSSESKIELSLDGEKVIDGFTANNTFHLLTYTKESSVINRYTFKRQTFEKTSYDLYKKGFCEKVNGVCNLKAIFKKREIQFISDKVPATISQAESKLKIYPTDTTIRITSDHRLGTTVLISLSLNNSDFEVKHYSNDYNFKENTRVKSNSFLYKNSIFQILASKRKCYLYIKSLSNNEVLKTYYFDSESRIAFNNSEIYRDNGSFSLESEVIRDTKKFLSHLSKGSIAISVEEREKNLVMVFGGTSVVSSGGMPMMNFPVASFGSFNLYMGAFSSVSNSKATYTRSLLNKESFNQEQGFASINIFELIHVYKTEEAELKKVIRENIFKSGSDYIYGHYDVKKGTYNLLKF